MWGSIISAGAGLLGGILSNNANANQAQEANRFSAEQSAQQMQFQERMANSSYQRGTEDMMKAGLNPMLAYSQGGASVPTGAMAVGQQAQMSNVALPAIQAYNSTAQTAMAQDRNPSVIEKTKQDTRTSASQEDLNDESRKFKSTSSDKMVQEIVNLKKLIQKMDKEIELIDTQKGVNTAVSAKSRQDAIIDRPNEAYGRSGFAIGNKFTKEGLSSAEGAKRLFQPWR